MSSDAAPSITWSHELRFYVSCCVYYAQACERVRVGDGPVPRYDYPPTGAERWHLRALLDHHAATEVRGADLVAARTGAEDALALFASVRPTRELTGVAWPTAASIFSDWQRVWIEVRRLERAGMLHSWSDDLLAIDPAGDPLRVVLLVASCGHRDAAHVLARTVLRDELTPVARAWLSWFLDETPLSTIGALARDAEETDPRFHPARARPEVVTAALCGHWSEVLAGVPPQPGAPSRWGIHRTLQAFAQLADPAIETRLREALADMFTRIVPYEPTERGRLSFDLLGMLPIIGLYQAHLAPAPAVATIAAILGKSATPVVDDWQPAEEVRAALRELIALLELAIARGLTVHADASTARPFRIWTG